MKKLISLIKVHNRKVIISILSVGLFVVILWPLMTRERSLRNSLGENSSVYYSEDVSKNFLQSLFNPSYVVIYTDKDYVTKISSINLSRNYILSWSSSENGNFEMYNSQISDDFKPENATKYSELLKYDWKNQKISINDIEKKDKTVRDYSKILDTRKFDFAREGELLNEGTGQIPLYLDINNEKALASIELGSGPYYSTNNELLRNIVEANKRDEESYKNIINDSLLHQITDIEAFEQSLIEIDALPLYKGDLLERYKRNEFYYNSTPSLSLLYAQRIEGIGIVLLIQHNVFDRSDYLDKYLLVYNQEEAGKYRLIYYEVTEAYP